MQYKLYEAQEVSLEERIEVLEELKKKEKGQATQADAVDAVARTLPALWRAEKMKKKAAKAGFDWRDISGALDKLSEELDELRAAALSGDGNPIEELGDLLFAAVKVGRFVQVDGEPALQGACEKFIRRFRRVEELADGPLSELDVPALEALWEEAKKKT